MRKVLIILALAFLCFACGSGNNTGYPSATIIEPGNMTYQQGENITFRGEVKDLDGQGNEFVIVGNGLTWISDIDGQIGRGKEFSTNSLSQGQHLITLTAYGVNEVKVSTSISLIIN